MSVHVCEIHLAMTRWWKKVMSNGGLASVDLDKFWRMIGRRRRYLDTSCPQMPLGILMSHECVWAELGIEEDWHRLLHDQVFNLELCKRYNDKAEGIVGRNPIVPEVQPVAAENKWPEPKGLREIFEAEKCGRAGRIGSRKLLRRRGIWRRCWIVWRSGWRICERSCCRRNGMRRRIGCVSWVCLRQHIVDSTGR